jgi:hypothetical protein
VFDRLILSNLIPEEQKAPFKAERARMSALLQRLTFSASTKSGPRESGGTQDGLTDPAELDNVVTEGRRERPRPSRPSGSWRASRAAPLENRKPWASPSTA